MSQAPSPKKQFGQNFLCQPHIINKIIHFAGPYNSTDVIIEIGPGPGALTKQLIHCLYHHLYLVEVDARMLDNLGGLAKVAEQRITVCHQDALALNLPNFAQGSQHKLKIIGNLPYHIATALILSWLPHYDLITDITVMLQKEVAERIMAMPGSKTYGSLSLLCQLDYNISKGLVVSPGAFYPPPKVDSMVIKLIPNARGVDNKTKKWLWDYGQVIFSQRRKTLRNTLKQILPVPEVLLEKAGIDGNLRPEQLSLEDYIKLGNAAVY